MEHDNWKGIMLTKNFSAKEITHSPTAIKLGIDNTLPDIYYGNAQNLAKYVLEPIRQYFGVPFSPLSWYRCPKLNEVVGGSKTSDHMIASAVDIRIKSISLMALAEYIRDNLQFDQVILEPTWVHISFRKDNNRNEVLTKTENGYVKGFI